MPPRTARERPSRRCRRLPRAPSVRPPRPHPAPSVPERPRRRPGLRERSRPASDLPPMARIGSQRNRRRRSRFRGGLAFGHDSTPFPRKDDRRPAAIRRGRPPGRGCRVQRIAHERRQALAGPETLPRRSGATFFPRVGSNGSGSGVESCRTASRQPSRDWTGSEAMTVRSLLRLPRRTRGERVGLCHRGSVQSTPRLALGVE